MNPIQHLMACKCTKSTCTSYNCTKYINSTFNSIINCIIHHFYSCNCQFKWYFQCKYHSSQSKPIRITPKSYFNHNMQNQIQLSIKHNLIKIIHVQLMIFNTLPTSFAFQKHLSYVHSCIYNFCLLTGFGISKRIDSIIKTIWFMIKIPSCVMISVCYSVSIYVNMKIII